MALQHLIKKVQINPSKADGCAFFSSCGRECVDALVIMKVIAGSQVILACHNPGPNSLSKLL